MQYVYFTFAISQVSGFPSYYYYSQTNALCVTGQLIGGGDRKGRLYLGQLLFVEECDPTVAHYFSISCTLPYVSIYDVVGPFFSISCSLFSYPPPPHDLT